MNYYIADLHFGHTAVIRFDSRPFQDVEEMEKILISNWNAVVRPGDTVYILGDFAWGKAEDWLRIIRKLKGQKVLIQGNHDVKQYPEVLRKEFADIKEYKEITDNGNGSEYRKVILSHYPILFYKHSNNRKYFMLCGHVHNTAENDYLEKWTAELQAARRLESENTAANCGQIYNVGCMMPWMQYTPRTLDQIIQGKEEYSNGFFI